MPKPKLHHYFVTGSFSFPVDMLRYDQAKVLTRGDAGDFNGYIIEGKVAPTRGRWASFLWTVLPANQVELHPPGGYVWEVKIGSMWEILKENEHAVLPEYRPQ